MKTVYTLVLLDDIAVLEKVDASPIRKFFVEYGPLGMAVYTKKLIERRENSVYRPLDAQGKKILSDIAEFCVLNQGTTREIFKANMPLMKMVEELKGKLIDNPYCLRSGIYESRGIICTNLVGSFSFKFLGQTAPLGFSSWIENNGKVKKYEIY